VAKAPSGGSDELPELCELTAFVQAMSGREGDARKSMLKALHLNPLQTSAWLNAAAVFEAPQGASDPQAGKEQAHKGDGTVRAMQEQKRCVKFAQKLLTWCTSNTALRLLRVTDGTSKKAFASRARACEVSAAYRWQRWSPG
jgi:hypothetical protein